MERLCSTLGWDEVIDQEGDDRCRHRLRMGPKGLSVRTKTNEEETMRRLAELKGLSALGLAAIAAVGVTACGSSSSSSSSSTDAKSVKVAMEMPGPINDKGFNASGYAGLMNCKKQGATTTFAEKVAAPDQERTMEQLAQNNNVVIGHGFEFGDPATKLAPKYPDVKFIITSNPIPPKAKNQVNVMPNSTQAAYLAGVAAGKATKTNKIGGIAGFDFPVLKSQMEALAAGAKSVNPNVTTKIVYLGTFDDVAKGKEAAQSMAASGIDVVYHIADAAGIGIINGAKAAGIKAIGWGYDQNAIAPSTVIASQIVKTDEMIGNQCKAVIAGTFEGGKVVVNGLKSGIVGLTKVYNEPADVQQAVDAATKAIEDGSATGVPEIAPGIPSTGPSSN